MKKIEITEENYWAYKRFYCANHGRYLVNKKQSIKLITFALSCQLTK